MLIQCLKLLVNFPLLKNHSLHSCISRVLTVNGLVNVNPPFSTTHKSTSLNRSPKNISQVITSMTSAAAQNLVEIPPWGLLGNK